MAAPLALAPLAPAAASPGSPASRADRAASRPRAKWHRAASPARGFLRLGASRVSARAVVATRASSARADASVRAASPARAPSPPASPAPRSSSPFGGAAEAEDETDAAGGRLSRFFPPPSPPRGASLGGLVALGAVAALALASPSLASDLDAASDLAAPGGSLTDGFLSAFLLIFFSEIGDKTFFIAVLLATQQSKSSVFAGTFGALAVMTLISVGIGQVFHVAEENLSVFTSDVPWDDYLAVALLLVFGVQTILGAEEETAEEEEEDAKVAVAGMQFDGQTALILSTFALVFAAEWGDKSFIATIALSAAASPLGVVLGATAGHGVATGIAVLVGDILGDVISERVVKYTGGALFILFAIATALDIPQN